jgi:GTP cyclohydrolase I
MSEVPEGKPGLLPRVRRAEMAAQALLACYGDEVPGTANRIARFLEEFHQEVDLQELMKTFDYEEPKNGGQPMVAISRIPLGGLCEHHHCPFFGTADIGYIPSRKVLGLSKFARLTKAAGHSKPTIQERLTNEIADAINKALDPKGVIVVLRAQHTCMTVRGIAAPGVVTVTSAVRGNFVHVPAARQEFFSLLKEG